MLIIKIGSVTKSRRAREILFDNGIRVNILRMPKDPDGCAHGVTTDPDRLDAVLDILIENGIVKDHARATITDDEK